MNTNQFSVHIGVDVGKHQLDFFCHEADEHFQVANSPARIRKALKQLAPLSVKLLVVEATGRHEQALVLAASHQQIPVVIAQPMAVRRFAGALGILAKTDKLDSRGDAHNGEKPPADHASVLGCQTEWVATFHRNRWQPWTGILNQGFLPTVSQKRQT